jgi:type IV pilus assembly protein PilY1
MLRLTRTRSLLLALAALALAPASSALAQAPDLREIQPDVMLLVDTSGSMDYAMGSVSGLGGRMPTCNGAPGSSNERSRWITLLEALTGQYSSSSYYCSTLSRIGFTGAPDQYYPHPFAQPFGTQGAGILDSYLTRVRFGLMTFDNVYGLLGIAPTSNQIMTAPGVWSAALALGPQGDYSYGNAMQVRFPGCATTYMVNGGARRSASASETFGGGLVSFGNATSDPTVINAIVQSALLGMRPYGSTPTGALLDDFRWFLNNDPDVRPAASGAGGDPYQACRSRYAILISDGQASDPFREVGCATAGYTCPYDLPTNIAADLCRWDGTQCTGLIDGLFTVAFDPSTRRCTAADGALDPVCTTGDPAHPIPGVCRHAEADPIGHPDSTQWVCAAQELDQVARLGGTQHAFAAGNLAQLISALSAALDQAAPGTTTRTAPSFTLAQSSFAAGTLGSASAPQVQYQMNSGFNMPSSAAPGTPWSGVLERTRWQCNASLVAVAQPLSASDRFQDVLNARNLTSSARQLYTAIAPVGAAEGGVILSTPGPGLSLPATSTGSTPRTTGVALSPFDTSNGSITPQHLGLAAGDTVTRQAIFDYVHGRAPAARAAARLGDIYHSNPALVTPPRVDIDDQAYALFRQRPEVSGRPTVIYVGTNDGILHAFAIEDDPTGAVRWTAGQELWGFVPTALLNTRLQAGMSGHQFMVDGTPVVRDVVLRRQPGDAAAADMYHTVLIVGLRQGGSVYVALDVTDPLRPAFLWQYHHDQTGLTYGRPGLGQALVNVGGAVQERAIAVLPGGMGTLDTSAAALARGTAGCSALATSQPLLPTGVTGTRAGRRCWTGTAGRSLQVVDVATGELIRSFDASTITSPITGGVSMFSGDVGQFASRAFVTDADGVLWRLDMSLPDPASWTFVPLYDAFWNDRGTDGQPVYDPPVVSVDNSGNPVIVLGGGDIDQLSGAAANRLASVTEVIDRTTTPATSRARVNWEVRLQAGEQVTGPIVLYSNYVYFGTFQSNQDPNNACAYGVSRLWGLHYLNSGGVPPSTYSSASGLFPQPGLEGTIGTGVLDSFYQTFGANQILLGVNVTQRPSCSTGAAVTDQYLGSRYQVSNLRQGDFQLVAQVSGGTTATSTTATAVQTISRTLPPPVAASRVMQWNPTADF